MCNLYSVTTNQSAIVAFTNAMRDKTGNLPPMPGVYPDSEAPIVRNAPDGVRELAKARWGMPTPKNILMASVRKKTDRLDAKGVAYDFKEMLRLERDSGVTNIRNTSSKHWAQWLGIGNRCVVPFTSFSEYNKEHGGDVWFAFDETRPLAVFAGIYIPQWKSVRKVKDGETVNDLFGFLTTEPNDVVAAVHPKAMPVILIKPEEIEQWMTAPVDEALKLQRPLPAGTLKIVATGSKTDGSH